ncbi:uncharacterized protein [Arachis hypogaea]|uniref:uncharacterized protein isoform X2 n=1 Tax=Arachis hypogaea TaxID=3818 RepID=UPI003B212A00
MGELQTCCVLCQHFGLQARISNPISLLSSFLCQAARALANLAAHGDSNSNNAVVGQEAGKKLLVPFGTCHLMIETGKPS